MRKRVYICGPISRGDLCANVNQSTAAFIALAKAGFAPLNPMLSVYAKPAFPDGPGEIYCIGTPMGNDEMQHADWVTTPLPKGERLLGTPRHRG